MKNVSRHCVESNVVPVDFPLDRTRLVRTFEIPGDAIAVLSDLYMLNLDLSVPSVGRVNRPIALNVVGWLIGECRCG
jgi:hypothetical protein